MQHQMNGLLSGTREEPAVVRVAQSLVEISHVHKHYGSHHVLDDVSITVHRGETVAIIGPSGSGKTTVLRCINFLVPYDSGRITVMGKLVGYREKGNRLVRDSDRNLNQLRSQVGTVFQRFNLFPHRSVLGNLTEGPIHVLRIPKREAIERAEAALARVGLAHKRDRYPFQLSGGEQQRVAIARALCMQPVVMLFDEVTSALDPELVGEVLAVMRQLSQDGMTMVVVTHELEFARRSADRTVFMEHGKVVVDQPTAEFFARPPTDRIASYLRAIKGEW